VAVLDSAGALIEEELVEEEPVVEGLEEGGRLEGEDEDEEEQWHNSLVVPDLMIKG
jgi:hypothetical protein